jgi:hypothetical protein
VIGKLAIRSLTAHPVRAAVLAAGFGVGVAVMAILLGVAEIVLDQARAPALVGGGDVIINHAPDVPARLLLSGTLQSDAFRPQIRVAAPTGTTALYLLHAGKAERVRARAGIPSLERALGDPETANASNWRDTADDLAWTQQSPESMLRYVDRFHPVPDAPAWASSWAEWLYFNGRGPDARFYLTFLVGPAMPDGRRGAGVRLQLDRGRGVETFAEGATLEAADALKAPDLTIGKSSVRLDGLLYRIHLDLKSPGGERVTGDLTLQGSPGRLIPPLEITGTRGWRTGYVVPVMSGTLDGRVETGGGPISFAGGTGYHDHNWGFWQGVSWQWGQVQQNGLSLLYGRVFPPPEAADPERLPGFVGVLGSDGPLGYTRDVTITEMNGSDGRPQMISVRARGRGVQIDAQFRVESAVVTRNAGSSGPRASGLDFLQMRGDYTVKGTAGGHTLNFTAPGSAETFRGRAR